MDCCHYHYAIVQHTLIQRIANYLDTCVAMTECYKVSEVQACIQAIVSGCQQINIDVQYENACTISTWATIPNGLLKFRRQTNATRSPHITLAETPISLLTTTIPPYKYTYELFTLDVGNTTLVDRNYKCIYSWNKLIGNKCILTQISQKKLYLKQSNIRYYFKDIKIIKPITLKIMTEQFGFDSTGQVSDLIMVKVVKTDNTAQTLTDVPLQIQYTWTNTVLQTNIYYATFDKQLTSAYISVSTALTGCSFLTAPTYCLQSICQQLHQIISYCFIILHRQHVLLIHPSKDQNIADIYKINLMMQQIMYKFYILSLILIISHSAAPGTTACTDPSYNTQTTCAASGYCKWTGSACAAYTASADCYRVNEIGACKSGGVYAALCTALGALNVQYDNVCGPTGVTKIDYNYVRFSISTTGLAGYSLTGITVADLQAKLAADKPSYLYQVFTVNIQIATNTELNAILDLYNAYTNELQLTTTHPYYIEKALFQTVQNLRDTDGITDALKTTTLGKFWTLAGILLKRLRTFSKHYQTNYYMINFAQTTFSRLYLTVNGQEHTTTFSWTQYTSNGYIQVISYPAQQYGVTSTNALSDVYFVNIIDDSAAQTAYSTLALTITYIYSGTTKTLATTNVIRMIAAKETSPYPITGGTTYTYVVASSDLTTAKKLVFTAQPAAASFAFYVAAS